MRRRFPRASFDDIEDAVALAMVDLVDYWVQLASSIDYDDPERTFWLACKRATWMATTFLTQEWDMRDSPLEALSGGEGEVVYDRPGRPAPTRYTASPEDVVLDDLDRERFQHFIADQLNQLGEWLRPFMSGVTTREQARQEGVSQSAIAYRWQRRLGSFVKNAETAGIGGAS